VLPERMVSLHFVAQPPSSVICGSGLPAAFVIKYRFGNIISGAAVQRIVRLDAVDEQAQNVRILGDNATGFIGESADCPLTVFTRCVPLARMIVIQLSPCRFVSSCSAAGR
jgi:hypothetical protein